MKTIILSFCVASILLITGCKKEATVAPATVSYEVSAINTSTGLVHWTSGSANISALKFGSSQSSIDDSTSVNTTTDLFSSSTNAIGSVPIKPGTYSYPYLAVQLSPTFTTPALYLQGSVTDGTTTLPVTISITDIVNLQGSQSETLNSGTSYLAQFSLDLSALTQGLSFTDFQSAALTNGTLVISSSSNTTLYSTIENNIAHALTLSVN